MSVRQERARIDEALAACGLDHARKVFTYTTPEELEGLFHIAEAQPRHAVVVEIGSYLGASACFLAAAIRPRGGRLYCIDTWNNDAMNVEGCRDTWAEFQQNTAPIAELLTAIRKSTAELAQTDLPAQVDLAFIDADHSYEAVRADFERIAPHVRRTGMVAFHDVGSYRGVSQFFGELLAGCEWRLSGSVGTLAWIARVRDQLR
ncbi:MAG: class I SAM-dependent methyltransferase [Planctomycetaceae bacterium]|nr:class I SAM-dependent methyltransferase [Planctomycetaceae bacterium]